MKRQIEENVSLCNRQIEENTFLCTRQIEENILDRSKRICFYVCVEENIFLCMCRHEYVCRLKRISFYVYVSMQNMFLRM